MDPRASHDRSDHEADEPRAVEAALAPMIPDYAERTESFRVPADPLDDALRRLFNTEMAKAAAAIDIAAIAGEPAAVVRAANTLKGMGGTVGLPGVSTLGDEIGRAARKGEFDRCRRLIGAVAFLWAGVAVP
jgi:hypothetical protein